MNAASRPCCAPLCPDIAVTASIDVLPEVREYERTLATVLNARVMPAVGDYVARLETRLRDSGGISTRRCLLMQSNGGVAGAAAVRRAPLVTALSGPAAGVVGARAVGAACRVHRFDHRRYRRHQRGYLPHEGRCAWR